MIRKALQGDKSNGHAESHAMLSMVKIMLERRGKKVAALVSVEDLELLEEMEDQGDIRAAKKALKEKGGITLEELKKKSPA